MPENLPEEHAAELFRRGIVPIHGIVEAMDAAEAAAFIGAAWARPLPPVVGRSSRHGCGTRAAPSLRRSAQGGAVHVTSPDEADAKAHAASGRASRAEGRARAAIADEAVAAAR